MSGFTTRPRRTAQRWLLDLAQPMTVMVAPFLFLMTGWASWLFCRHPPRTRSR
jgi:hypothetical protein